ncbi:hypothetical protein [Streptomyces sp. NPDC050504]|uniref:hypothetical protein n=1 Tax=Streptomyces sp. NPDC050504 TaxID=3365618 RepID=UPI00379318D1
MSYGGPHDPRWQPNGGPHPPWPPNGGPHPQWPPGPGPYPYPHPSPYPPPQPPRVSLWQRFREDEWPTTRELLRPARRVHGCLWALLLPCFWFALFPLVFYPMARSARRHARRRFPVGGPHRIQDPQVLRIQKARAWSALAATFVIMAVYATPEDWEQAQDQYQMRLVITPWLLLLSAPVVVGAVFWLAPRRARPGMRRGIRPAALSALWYFGAFASMPLVAVGGVMLSEPLSQESPARFAILLVMCFLVLWLFMFVAFSSPTVVRSAFNTAGVHAALPALLTGALVWELSAINLALGGMPPGPPPLQICSVVFGPLSVTAVAWWEVRRLRTRHGIRIRV